MPQPPQPPKSEADGSRFGLGLSEAERLDRLCSVEAIRQLVALYSHCVDSRDLDRLVGLFVEDVRVATPPEGTSQKRTSTARTSTARKLSGRAALKESFAQSLSEVGTTILKVTTHIINFAGDFGSNSGNNPDNNPDNNPGNDSSDSDHATGNVYAHGDIQIGDRWIHQVIRYDDRYERREGVWYFVGRKHQLFYGADVGQNPLEYPPANWPESNIGTGTLPHNQPSWQLFWKNDVP